MAAITIVLVLFVCTEETTGAWENVALNKLASASSILTGSYPGLAVDGNTVTSWYTCMQTGLVRSPAWWKVDLQRVVQDAIVKIYFNKCDMVLSTNPRRNGVHLYTSTNYITSYPGGQLCHTVTGKRDGTDIPDVVRVMCSGRWRYFMLYTNTINDASHMTLDIEEVEVWACSTGMYGANCDKFCSSRQCAVTPTSCDHYTGACPPGGCKAGRMGTDCLQACSNNKYGANCAQYCSSRQCAVTSALCNRYTGECPTEKCKPGYRGIDCAEACSSGRYGPDCNRSCSIRKCVDFTSCDHVTGTCMQGCQPGWSGYDCTQICLSGTYNDDCTKLCTERHCKVSSTSCDHVTGACSTKDCLPGWMGADCAQECNDSTYGANCAKSCIDRQCMTSSSSCDRETGLCPDGCLDGWREEDCTDKCPDGTFGRGCYLCSIRHCQGLSDCPDNGTCSDGCQDGWMLDNCTLACLNGSYGSGCNNICGNCTGDDICDHEAGGCPGNCMPGWRGIQCQQICQDDSYGVNCAGTCGQCNSTCDSVTGFCPLGCKDGYNGTRCEMKLDVAQASELVGGSSVIPVVVGTLSIMLLIIVVITFVVYKRRQSATSTKSKSAVVSAVHKNDNVYVNVSLAQEDDTVTQKQPTEIKDISNPQPTMPHFEIQPEEEVMDEGKHARNTDYYNDIEDVIREIAVGDLEHTVQKIKHREGGFEVEYNRLPTGFLSSYDDSQKPENDGKNKFRGYYPYDYNRVRLSLLHDTPGSDYINASLMHSWDRKKRYIAAQAPNKKTVEDFWRMIWEHQCGRAIMLTSLVEDKREKCYKYWPENDVTDPVHFHIEVKVTDTHANYTIRYIKVISLKTGECRSVVQYHFTSWPDHGVPDILALVHFIWMIRQTDAQTDEPLLVHCSAGIGRTGTYITVDSLLDQAREEGVVDVLGYVSVMRAQRKNMIQTKEQYECVFQCLVEMTKFGYTSMSMENFTTRYSSKGMDSIIERKTLKQLTQMVLCGDNTGSPSHQRTRVDGFPDVNIRVSPSLRHLEGNLQVEVQHQHDGFEKQLWKFVEAYQVQNIIIISPLQVHLDKELMTSNGYKCTMTRASQNTIYSDVKMMEITLQGDGYCSSVRVFKLDCSPTLDNLSSCLLNNTHLQNLSGEITPVVIVHSKSEWKNAAFLCLMVNVLSEILSDHNVNVIHHVRTYHKSCADRIFTEGDVEKLYDFAEKCVQKFKSPSTCANM